MKHSWKMICRLTALMLILLSAVSHSTPSRAQREARIDSAEALGRMAAGQPADGVSAVLFGTLAYPTDATLNTAQQRLFGDLLQPSAPVGVAAPRPMPTPPSRLTRGLRQFSPFSFEHDNAPCTYHHYIYNAQPLWLALRAPLPEVSPQRRYYVIALRRLLC